MGVAANEKTKNYDLLKPAQTILIKFDQIVLFFGSYQFSKDWFVVYRLKIDYGVVIKSVITQNKLLPNSLKF